MQQKAASGPSVGAQQQRALSNSPVYELAAKGDFFKLLHLIRYALGGLKPGSELMQDTQDALIRGFAELHYSFAMQPLPFIQEKIVQCCGVLYCSERIIHKKDDDYLRIAQIWMSLAQYYIIEKPVNEQALDCVRHAEKSLKLLQAPNHKDRELLTVLEALKLYLNRQSISSQATIKFPIKGSGYSTTLADREKDLDKLEAISGNGQLAFLFDLLQYQQFKLNESQMDALTRGLSQCANTFFTLCEHDSLSLERLVHYEDQFLLLIQSLKNKTLDDEESLLHGLLLAAEVYQQRQAQTEMTRALDIFTNHLNTSSLEPRKLSGYRTRLKELQSMSYAASPGAKPEPLSPLRLFRSETKLTPYISQDPVACERGLLADGEALLLQFDYDNACLKFETALKNYNDKMAYLPLKQCTAEVRSLKSTIEQHLLQAEEGKRLNTNAQLWGFCTKNVAADGNCFFHAMAESMGMEGKDEHLELRAATSTHVTQCIRSYASFATDDEDKKRLLNELCTPGCSIGNVAISAFARVFNITIVVVRNDCERVDIFRQPPDELGEEAPIYYVGYEANVQRPHYQLLQAVKTLEAEGKRQQLLDKIKRESPQVQFGPDAPSIEAKESASPSAASELVINQSAAPSFWGAAAASRPQPNLVQDSILYDFPS